MKVKHLYYVMSLLVAMSMVLAACAPQVAATTEAPAQTEAPAATEAPATEAPATAAPTEAPTTTERHGGWLDEMWLIGALLIAVAAPLSFTHRTQRRRAYSSSMVFPAYIL